MKIVTILIGAFLLAPALAVAGGTSKVDLSVAENICALRAFDFSESIRGQYGEHPDNNMVQDHYRSCVHAKSGDYPRQKLVLNGHLLFRLNKVLGI